MSAGVHCKAYAICRALNGPESNGICLSSGPRMHALSALRSWMLTFVSMTSQMQSPCSHPSPLARHAEAVGQMIDMTMQPEIQDIVVFRPLGADVVDMRIDVVDGP